MPTSGLSNPSHPCAQAPEHTQEHTYAHIRKSLRKRNTIIRHRWCPKLISIITTMFYVTNCFILRKKISFQRNLFGTRLERQFLKFYAKTSEINKRMPEMISAGRNPGEFLWILTDSHLKPTKSFLLLLGSHKTSCTHDNILSRLLLSSVDCWVAAYTLPYRRQVACTCPPVVLDR